MLDTLCRFFLFFSQDIFIIPLLIIGLLFINRSLFFQVSTVFLFSMVMNVALKVGFHIPLPETVAKNWFAFPSGHMQASTVLYGCLITQLKKHRLYQVLLISLIIGIGLSLIHFEYHNYQDVAGGAFFGLLVLFGYHYLQKHCPQFNLFLVILTGLFLSYIHMAHSHIPEHALQAAGGLLSLFLGQNSFEKKHFLSAKKMFSFLSVLIIASFILLKVNFSFPLMTNSLLLVLIFASSAFHGSKNSLS